MGSRHFAESGSVRARAARDAHFAPLTGDAGESHGYRRADLARAMRVALAALIFPVRTRRAQWAGTSCVVTNSADTLKLLCSVAALSLLPSAAIAQVQINQTFVPQGPSPIVTTENFQPQGSLISLPIATASGAVQAICSTRCSVRCSSAQPTVASGALPTAAPTGRR